MPDTTVSPVSKWRLRSILLGLPPERWKRGLLKKLRRHTIIDGEDSSTTHFTCHKWGGPRLVVVDGEVRRKPHEYMGVTRSFPSQGTRLLPPAEGAHSKLGETFCPAGLGLKCWKCDKICHFADMAGMV